MNKILHLHIPGLILLSIALTPSIPALAPFRVEDMFAVISILLILLSKQERKRKIGRQLRVRRYLTVIGVAGILGLCSGMLFLDVVPGSRDLLFIPQAIKYYLLFWVFCRTLQGETEIISFSYYIFLCALICSIVAIAQYWNLFGINSWLTPLYFKRELALQQMQDAEMTFRVVGTMGNPNYFGYMLCWLTGWTLAFRMHSGKSTILQLLALPLLGLMGIAMLLLQSRTTLLGVIAMLGAIFLLAKNFKKKTMTIVSAIIVVCSGVLFLSSDLLAERGFGSRLRLDDESTSVSYNARVRDFVQPIIYMAEHPYLIPCGQGPSKGTLRSDSHNGFTWMFLRFGLVGAGAYLMLIVRQIKYGRKIQAKGFFAEYRYIAMASLLCCIVWIIGDLGGNIFKDPRLMSLNMISMGCLQVAINWEKRFSQRRRILQMHTMSEIDYPEA